RTGHRKDPQIEHAIIKTMAAFFNTKGGTLIVGIDDEGTPIRIAKDGFASNDKWQLHLVNITGRDLSDVTPGLWDVSISRHENGEDVAIVECQRSSAPIYTANNGEFYVRQPKSWEPLKLCLTSGNI